MHVIAGCADISFGIGITPHERTEGYLSAIILPRGGKSWGLNKRLRLIAGDLPIVRIGPLWD
jgi:hypothetical protein